MHLQDGPQLAPPGQVARVVKEKARPWKAIIALVLAIASAIASEWVRHNLSRYLGWSTDTPSQIVAAALDVAFLVFGIIATIGLSGKARSALEPRMGSAHAAIVRYAVLLVGGFTTLVVTLVLFGVPVGQLITASALTSVFIGIAAQQALSNIFAVFLTLELTEFFGFIGLFASLGLLQFAGYVGIVTAFTAWYASFAILSNDMGGRIKLPAGDPLV